MNNRLDGWIIHNASFDDILSIPSRGILSLDYANGGPGHMINVERINKQLWLFEAYSGKAVRLSPKGLSHIYEPIGGIDIIILD